MQSLVNERIFFYGLLAVVCLVAVLCFAMIWTYLSKKPLGMQTMYDNMIKDLIVISIGALVGSSLANLDIAPTPPAPATLIVLLQYCFGFAFFVQLFLAIAIR